MTSSLIQLLLRWAILAIGVTLATKLIPGIACNDAGTLVAVVLVLSFLNILIKPILVLFTLPFIVLTMGLGLIVINALLFLLVAQLVEGFTVNSFWSALGAAVIVGLTNLILSRLLSSSGRPPRPPKPPPRRTDVIDI